MHEFICPQSHNAFKIDETGYADILKQVRDGEFEQQLGDALRAINLSPPCFGLQDRSWWLKVGCQRPGGLPYRSATDHKIASHQMSDSVTVTSIKGKNALRFCL